jgi:hypothetical protein
MTKLRRVYTLSGMIRDRKQIELLPFASSSLHDVAFDSFGPDTRLSSSGAG